MREYKPRIVDEILKDKKFTFEISIPSMKGKTVKAEVRNAQNEIQGKAFELEFDKTGAAKYQIKRCIFMDWIKMRNIP